VAAKITLSCLGANLVLIKNMLMQGLSLHQKGELAAAQVIYLEILKLNPNHLDALQLAGAIAGQTQCYEQSIEFLSKAININKTYPAIYFNLAVSFQELKQFESAIAYYDEAIKLKPNYSEAYSNRGYCLKSIKLVQAAITSFNKAIFYNPSFSDAYNSLGNALRELKKFDDAITNFN